MNPKIKARMLTATLFINIQSKTEPINSRIDKLWDIHMMAENIPTRMKDTRDECKNINISYKHNL